MTQPYYFLAYAQRTALFTTVRKRRQPRYVSTHQWIMKMWHIDTMAYWALKENEVVKVEGKRVALEKIILSEVTRDPRKANVVHSLSQDIHNFKSSHVSLQHGASTETWKVYRNHQCGRAREWDSATQAMWTGKWESREGFHLWQGERGQYKIAGTRNE